MERKRVLVGMSGGVDSAAAAALLQDSGYEAAGCTLRLLDSQVLGQEVESGCCSLEDVEDARSVARRLGMDFFVFNFKDAFRRHVIEDFAAAYQAGRTPNPCIQCNRHIKFSALLQRADELEMDYIATGHYARVGRDGETGRWQLLRGLDRRKDQSYVLYPLTQRQLSRLLLPLGGMEKEAVRALAEARGLCNARKPDSQDICFVPDGNYPAFLQRYGGLALREGDFVDTQGRVLGRHRGLPCYTTGQRRGLGVSAGRPLYVLGKDGPSNTVVLGDEEARKATLEGLRSAEGFLKNRIAKVINLRNTPEITFILDQSIEYGVSMSRRIDEVIAGDDENARNREDVEAQEDTHS